MTTPSPLLSLTKEYLHHACVFETQENRKNEHKQMFKQLFIKFIHTYTTEETEGLIHSLQSIKQMDVDAVNIGIAIQKASKWLKSKVSQNVETPRRTPRKSGYREESDAKSQQEEVVQAAKAYQSAYDMLFNNEEYLKGRKIRANLIDIFKYEPLVKRQEMLRSLQCQLNVENKEKQLMHSVPLCMIKLILLTENADKIREKEIKKIEPKQ